MDEKMKACSILLLSIFAFGSCQVLEDESLRDACSHAGGLYTPRSTNREEAVIGDKCAMSFNVWTADQLDAESFCELYAPWRLLKATPGRPTKCEVEATLICDPGWTQMFGYCFRMPEKHRRMGRAEAEKTCKLADKRAEIAFLHHKYIVGVWKRFFTHVSQIWVSASETYEQYIQMQDGNALALAVDGNNYEFTAKPGSLIRIDAGRKLQVLCQYKPPVTPAEIHYLTRRYSEIYYPSVELKTGALVRTASFYGSTLYLNSSHECAAAMRPFFSDSLETLFPDRETLDRLTDSAQTGLTFARVDARAELHKETVDVACAVQLNHFYMPAETGKGRKDLAVEFEPPEPRTTCDNMVATAVMHPKTQLRVMSDFRHAPKWCKLGARRKYKYPVPDGYTQFVRSHNGLHVAHKLIKKPLKWAEASERCKMEDAFLSGADTMEELAMLEEMVKAAGKTKDQVWLGGRRRFECLNTNFAYSEDKEDRCSRANVMQWQNNVAQRFEEAFWRDSRIRPNPDYSGRGQECLSLVVGNPDWANPASGGHVDDTWCDEQRWFFCEKPVPEIVAEGD